MSSTQLMDSAQLRRALTRIAHEILERNAGAENLGLVGVRTHGVPLAARIAESIGLIEGGEAPPVGAMDVTLYRDDVGRLGRTANLQPTDIPFDVDGMTIVLVDDVLYTGRTIRSAMDALIDFGRPAAIQLAVAVDRGHRELPIRPDYVGKNVPTARNQKISVRLSELGDRDGVYLEEVSDGS